MKALLDTFKESLAQSNLLLELSPQYIIVCMTFSFLCALLIYAMYRLFYRGACYSENFNTLLILVTLVTTFIIMTISSNIVLSLGMVGALSIVRFRAAIKDPLDVGFLFWGIAAGLTCGAGLYQFAVIGSLFIAVIYVLSGLLKGLKGRYLLVVRYEDKAAEAVDAKAKALHGKLKNKIKTKGETELTLQVRLGKKSTAVDELSAIDGVKSAMLVEFTGDL